MRVSTAGRSRDDKRSMLFTSRVFIAFFVLVYATYLLLRHRHRAQNRLLLVASYVFYGYWDWRFLSLLVLSTLVDYVVGARMARSDRTAVRRALLTTSIVANLGILATFKYFNFFAENFAAALGAFGLHADFATLNIVLPVGISFYTFQSMSYTIDVYRRQLEPTRDLLDFALYVSFFPQLVAGPIERAVRLLPQITTPRTVCATGVNAGLFLIVWGYFKKVVIADNVAVVADTVFNNYAQHQGLDLVLGALAFTVQIYCDFSAYSDIARGLAKLMGFELMLNFRLPYFARTPSEFWQRWHVSLSSWLRDYLYIPLGGNRGGALRTNRNLLTTMVLGGLWHGAAWNFVIWGVFHGAILVIYRGFARFSGTVARQTRFVQSAIRTAQLPLMFLLTVVGWVIFRSQSIEQIVHFLTACGLAQSSSTAQLAADLIFFSVPLAAYQIAQHASRNLLVAARWPFVLRPVYLAGLIGAICVFGKRASSEFIYFQF